MALKLDHRSVCTPTADQPAPASWPDDGKASLRFDRRHEGRATTSGWARLICLDPFKSFLGGTVELADVSHSGLGFRSERPIPVGEYVEVRLAPFRVRGRIAVVMRCDEVPATIDPVSGQTVAPRHYRIGVRQAQATRAA